MLHEVNDPAAVLEGRALTVGLALVDETDLEALVQEGHDLQPLDHRLGPKLDLLEDRRVRPEGDRRAGAAPWGRSVWPQFSDRLAAVLELEHVVLVVAINLEQQAGRQCVHHRDADAVQSAADLVSGAAELRARVQGGEHDLGRAATWVVRVWIHRDAPPVVDHPAAAVGEQRDVDPGAVPGHRLVDGVVDDLPDQVVKAARSGRTDVHPGPEPHWLKAFENRDCTCVISPATTLRQYRSPRSNLRARPSSENRVGAHSGRYERRGFSSGDPIDSTRSRVPAGAFSG